MKKVSFIFAILLLLMSLISCGAKQKGDLPAITENESLGIAGTNVMQITPEQALNIVKAILSDKSNFEDIEYELYENRHIEGNEYIVVHSYTQQPIFNDSGNTEYYQQYTVNWFYIDKNTGEVFVENYVDKEGSELIVYENIDDIDEMQRSTEK